MRQHMFSDCSASYSLTAALWLSLPHDFLRDHQGYIQMGKNQIIRTIKKFIRALKHEGISVNRVILYGSYAKGKARTDSDIDVAVVSKDFGKDRVEEGMSLFRIAGGIDTRLEPVPISLKTFENDTWIPLIYEIREYGIDLNMA